MRILNVNATLDSRIGGGTAERTFQMSRHLALSGASVTVVALDTGELSGRIAGLFPAQAVLLPVLLQRFQFPVPRMGILRRLVAEADIVHLMGHWSILNALVYLIARSMGKPYVVCPAGALPIYGRSRLIKRLYNLIVGHRLIQNAAGWIAVTKSEYPAFERYGVGPESITVIPNGVDANEFPLLAKASVEDRPWGNAPYVLFMGRLSLIKGPDLLLEAFAHVVPLHPSYHLVFAGPDDGMQEMLQATAAARGVVARVHFVGRVAGEQKVALYRLASMLVVPSRHEAMSVVALEAGICGTPVMLTDQCGFSEIRAVDTRLEVHASVDGLARGLAELLAAPAGLPPLGRGMQRFVAARYAWDSVVGDYLRLYGRILGEGSPGAARS